MAKPEILRRRVTDLAPDAQQFVRYFRWFIIAKLCVEQRLCGDGVNIPFDYFGYQNPDPEFGNLSNKGTQDYQFTVTGTGTAIIRVGDAASETEAIERVRRLVTTNRCRDGRAWRGIRTVETFTIDHASLPEVKELTPPEEPTLPTGEPSEDLVAYKAAIHQFAVEVAARRLDRSIINNYLTALGVELIPVPKSFSFSYPLGNSMELHFGNIVTFTEDDARRSFRERLEIDLNNLRSGYGPDYGRLRLSGNRNEVVRVRDTDVSDIPAVVS
jgi:hypothetical protein